MNSIEIIAQHYGWERQSAKAIEEAGRLSTAICEYNLRTADDVDVIESYKRFDELVDSLAGMKIMVEELVVLLDCAKECSGVRRNILKVEQTKVRKDEEIESDSS